MIVYKLCYQCLTLNDLPFRASMDRLDRDNKKAVVCCGGAQPDCRSRRQGHLGSPLCWKAPSLVYMVILLITNSSHEFINSAKRLLIYEIPAMPKVILFMLGQVIYKLCTKVNYIC